MGQKSNGNIPSINEIPCYRQFRHTGIQPYHRYFGALVNLKFGALDSVLGPRPSHSLQRIKKKVGKGESTDINGYFRSAFLHRRDPNTKVVQVQYLNGKKVCLAVKCLVFKYHLYQYSDHHLNTRLVLKWHQNTSPNFRCSCYLNIGH